MPTDTINDTGIAHLLLETAYTNVSTCTINTAVLEGENSPDGCWHTSHHVYIKQTHYIVNFPDKTVHICESEEEANDLMRQRKREILLAPVQAMQTVE